MKDVLFCMILVLALFFCGGGLREAKARKPTKGVDGMEPIAVTVRRAENGFYTLQAPHREAEQFGDQAALLARLHDFPGARILFVIAEPDGAKLFGSLSDGQELSVTFE